MEITLQEIAFTSLNLEHVFYALGFLGQYITVSSVCVLDRGGKDQHGCFVPGNIQREILDNYFRFYGFVFLCACKEDIA
ncbi:hypothetical protein D3C87_1800200 [compost metagenome]